MVFEHTTVSGLDFELEAVTTEDGRIYTVPSGKKYASITTVLSDYKKEVLQNWINRVGQVEADRVAKKAARRGEGLHDAYEKYIRNQLTQLDIRRLFPDVHELFIPLRKHIDANVGKVYAIEQPLYSDRLRIAGRVDLIADWGGKISTLDFKSSKRLKKEEDIENYFMQCSGYCEMFEERTGIAIEQIVVAIGVEGGSAQIFVKEKHKYLPMLEEYIGNFYRTTKLDVL